MPNTTQFASTFGRTGAAASVRGNDGQSSSIVVMAVGDIMLGDSSTCVGWGVSSRWPGEQVAIAMSSARALFKGADIVIGNLESPLARRGVGATRWKRDQMRADPKAAIALRDTGFKVLSIANNHAMQHGLAAFHETVRTLESAGIQVAGVKGDGPWSCRPVVLEVHDTKVGVLAYCWRPPQYLASATAFAEGDVESAVSDIGRLLDDCHAVIVSLHWGDEFFDEPSELQVVAARRLISAGATVVFGHHPHVLRPIERYGNGLIAYSLGNFLSDMTWLPEARTGAVLRCEISDGKVANFDAPTILTDSGYRVAPGRSTAVTLAHNGKSQHDYDAGVRRTLNRQRWLAYRHALVNIHRFSPTVFAELVVRTLRNKLTALIPKQKTAQ